MGHFGVPLFVQIYKIESTKSPKRGVQNHPKSVILGVLFGPPFERVWPRGSISGLVPIQLSPVVRPCIDPLLDPLCQDGHIPLQKGSKKGVKKGSKKGHFGPLFDPLWPEGVQRGSRGGRYRSRYLRWLGHVLAPFWTLWARPPPEGQKGGPKGGPKKGSKMTIYGWLCSKPL